MDVCLVNSELQQTRQDVASGTNQNKDYITSLSNSGILHNENFKT